jgi:hypothetical protein
MFNIARTHNLRVDVEVQIKDKNSVARNVHIFSQAHSPHLFFYHVDHSIDFRYGGHTVDDSIRTAKRDLLSPRERSNSI